jgi:omega-amidase
MSKLSVTIIQTDLVWENPTQNRKNIETLILNVQETTDVIILPEMFTTGFTMNAKELAEPMNGETVEWMKNLALKKEIAIGGSVAITEKGKYYNRFLWVTPDGEVVFYDKRHLFSFAQEDKHYQKGIQEKTVQYKGWNLKLMVCYDLRFPVWSRNNHQTPYDCLIYVANWPQVRIQAWKTLLEARAHENVSYVIGVNRIGTDVNNNIYNGCSVAFNFKGESLFHSEPYQPFTQTVYLYKEELNAFRDKFPALKDGDRFKVEE